MPMTNATLLAKYYESYLNTEIAFTKDIIKTIGMDPRQVFLKSSEGQWACIINSMSFSLARVIIGTKGTAYEKLASPNPPAGLNLKLSFYKQDGQQLGIFLSCKVKEIVPYMNSKDLVIVTLAYTQRPPEDLIEKIGRLLEANDNALRRKEDRIPINAESCRKLGIPKEECIAIIQNVPRRCILRDISFGGAKIVILGMAKFLMGKDVQLSLEFDDPHEVIQLKGTIASTSEVQGRKDMVVAGVVYDEATLSLSYKIHINNYLTSSRKADLNPQADAQGSDGSSDANFAI
ncbi:MAG: PilZ domain-containing protein [Treponema sp.]|nr:PilZ domain-containing protein [Treponema sp.]